MLTPFNGSRVLTSFVIAGCLILVLGVSATAFDVAALHSTWLASVGTGMMAGAISSLAFSFYERQKERESEKLVRTHAPVSFIRDDASLLYDRAGYLLREVTDGTILTSDIRWMKRSSEDVETQAGYLRQVQKHIKNQRNVTYKRAVSACDHDEWARVRSHLEILMDGTERRVYAKCYKSNPIGIDVLITDRAVLLALSDPSKGPRIAIIIEQERTAKAMQSWFESTIWEEGSNNHPRAVLKPADLDPLTRAENPSGQVP